MQPIPPECRSYKKTPVFSEDTVPAGLLRAHRTKSGTWGRIVVLEGALIYRILEPELETHFLNSEQSGVVEPEVLHEVEPNGKVKFYVDFHR